MGLFSNLKSKISGLLSGRKEKPPLLRPGQAESDAIRKQVDLFLKERKKARAQEDARKAASKTAVPAYDWMYEPEKPKGPRALSAAEYDRLQDLFESDRKPSPQERQLRRMADNIIRERSDRRGENERGLRQSALSHPVHDWMFEDGPSAPGAPSASKPKRVLKRHFVPRPKTGGAEMGRVMRQEPAGAAKSAASNSMQLRMLSRAASKIARQREVAQEERRWMRNARPRSGLPVPVGKDAALKEPQKGGKSVVPAPKPVFSHPGVAALADLYESHGIPADLAQDGFRPLSIVLKGKPETDAIYSLMGHLKSMGARPEGISPLQKYFRYRRAQEDAASEGSRRFTESVNERRRGIADAGNDLLLIRKERDADGAAAASQPLLLGNLNPYAESSKLPEASRRVYQADARLGEAIVRFAAAKGGKPDIDARTKRELERIEKMWGQAYGKFTPEDSGRLELARQFIGMARSQGFSAEQQALPAPGNGAAKDATPFFDRVIAPTGKYSAPIVDEQGFRHIPPVKKTKGPNGATTIRRME
ncbi:MAG: hypothetical protein WCX64_00185 [Candidatus Micrarchaeia archaeon]